ncbi:MAG TPA: NAD(P)/FAD-dependent oxidoreductase [Sphingomonas sp.]|nr:NAD(P)/FAD-dependent oxidoreductase [Sphingomonas sp.]
MTIAGGVMREIDIAIVGGGAAGIGAARAIAGSGRSALILEAGDRLGGRAWTVNARGLALDLGCGWLHSARRNAWASIAREMGVEVEHTPMLWRRQYRDLGFPPAEREEALRAVAAFHERLREHPSASDRAADAFAPGCRWNPYLEALSGYLNGAEFEHVSAADYLAYDDAAGEENWRLPGGYGALVVRAAPAEIPVRFAAPVTRIDRRGKRLRLETPGGAILARAAIVTVPTPVLALGRLAFDPPLPDKQAAAEALPLGLADKLFLALDDAGIDADAHLIGNPHRAETGSYMLRPFGRPIVECFYGGRAARMLEREGEAAACAFAVDELAALLGSAIRAKLRPLAHCFWGRERWIVGSYSHALPGRRAARATLAEPVEERIFFAGEACSPDDFTTAHGAHDTGATAARMALAFL